MWRWRIYMKINHEMSNHVNNSMWLSQKVHVIGSNGLLDPEGRPFFDSRHGIFSRPWLEHSSTIFGMKKNVQLRQKSLSPGGLELILERLKAMIFIVWKLRESVCFLLDLEKNWPLVNILMLLPMSKLVNLREYSWWIKLHFPSWAPGKTRASMSHSHLHVAAALYLR